MSGEHVRIVASKLPEPIGRLWDWLNTDNLFQDGAILAVATVASGGLNYLFQVFMGRALGPEQFGAFGALFALFYLLTVLGRGIRYSASHFAAEVAESARAASLHRGVLMRALLLGGGVLVVLTLLCPVIATFLGVDPRIVVVVGLVLPPALALSAGLGSLEGHQYFVALGASKILQAGLKLLCGAGLVLAGFGLYGAFAGILLGIVLTLVAIVYFLRGRIQAPAEHVPDFAFGRAYRYSGPAVLAGFCLAVPANADVILVKHLFPATEAGLYTATSVLGKVLIFLPMGISIALFPKVSADHARTGVTRTDALFDRALLAAGLGGGAVALSYWIAPELFLGVFFGASYVPAAPMLQWYGLAMLAFVLAVVVLNYELARDRLTFVYLFGVVSLIEIGLIALFHDSMLQIIQLILLINAALFACGLIRVKIQP